MEVRGALVIPNDNNVAKYNQVEETFRNCPHTGIKFDWIIIREKYIFTRKKEKLEEVKARLDFGEARKKSTKAQESSYSESRTMSPRRHRYSHSLRQSSSVFTRLKRERSRSPRHDHKSKTIRESTVFMRHRNRGQSISAYSDSRQESSRYTKNHSESEDSKGGHWKSKSRKHKSSIEDDDLSQPWVCAKTDPFTSQIRHFNFPKTRMHSHVKTYNGSEDPEDHLKIFQAAAKKKRWAMPTYNDLKEAFLKNYLQQKKCIRDPIVLHNIKQTNGESTKDFIQRARGGFKSGKEKGPFGLETSGRGSQAGFQKRGGFCSQHMQQRRPDRFTLLTKTPKEILALEKGKFKTPPSMTTPVEKRNANKFCEFHGEVGHNTDECNHLRRQIEDMLKAGKLSHIIKELKQNSEKDH
ncbi:hypothetical protein Tco_0413125 [Tanacetum coccineum]